MGQITIRGMDIDFENKVRAIAQKSGKSLNRVILEMLYQVSGDKNKVRKPRADSLRDLAGGWSREEGAEFMDSIKSCEQIDEDMWR